VVSGIHESQSATEPPAPPRHPYPLGFYAIRKRAYTGLLLFIVLVGLPMVAVPHLRNRLSGRIFELKAAISGDMKPAIAQVGANHEGFPKEFEIPVPAGPQIPPLPSVERKAYVMIAPGVIAPSIRRVPGKPRIAEMPSTVIQSEPPVEQTLQADPGASQEAQSDIKFQQGGGEKAAYDLLIRSDSTIGGMVKGSNPSLHFKSWDAAHKGEDVYLVRLRFQSDGNPDAEYIWEVKIQTSEVTPLSYNAKNIQ
jgi:hypothetical protein